MAENLRRIAFKRFPWHSIDNCAFVRANTMSSLKKTGCHGRKILRASECCMTSLAQLSHTTLALAFFRRRANMLSGPSDLRRSPVHTFRTSYGGESFSDPGKLKVVWQCNADPLYTSTGLVPRSSPIAQYAMQPQPPNKRVDVANPIREQAYPGTFWRRSKL